MKLLVTVNGRERAVELGDGSFTLDGKPLAAGVSSIGNGCYSILLDGASYEVHVQTLPDGGHEVYLNGRRYTAQVRDPRKLRRQGGGLDLEGRQNIVAPMPGKIVRLLVANHQEVGAGQGLLVIEAMKMQNEIKSPKAGRAVDIRVAQGEAVTAGQVLLAVE